MIYQVVITSPAEIDMVEIGRYISRELHSPKAAFDLQDGIDEKILSLEEMPKRYAVVKDEKLARFGYRVARVKNYLIFYIVDDQAKPQTVNIVRVLYAMRDWAHLLHIDSNE